MAIDAMALLTQLTSGAVVAACRLVLSVATLLVGVARIDASPHPPWLDERCGADALTSAYRAALALHHTHSNPVMLTFVELVALDAVSILSPAQPWTISSLLPGSLVRRSPWATTPVLHCSLVVCGRALA
jgi:hypothetical protein